jgi:hypothetical protein
MASKGIDFDIFSTPQKIPDQYGNRSSGRINWKYWRIGRHGRVAF